MLRRPKEKPWSFQAGQKTASGQTETLQERVRQETENLSLPEGVQQEGVRGNSAGKGCPCLLEKRSLTGVVSVRLSGHTILWYTSEMWHAG